MRSARRSLLQLSGLLLTACGTLLSAECACAQPRVESTVFGELPDGRAVHLYTLTNSRGLEAKIMTYGATLVTVRTPDRQGRFDDLTLHLDSLADYAKGHPLFGSIVGRFSNRIAGAAFTIDGTEYKLEANAGKNHIHGGGRTNGFQWQLWQAEPYRTADAAGVKLSLVSPDGQAGYPGTLSVSVLYALTEDDALRMEYTASTDKPTHVNLTNHAYWNLAGAASGEMLDQVLALHADHYLPSDSDRMPTGEILPVKDTPMDFTRPLPIGARLDQLERRTYDHCYVIHQPPGQNMALAAIATDPASGRVMKVYTTQPGVQFYTGNRKGFCLETQHFPNSPNVAKFPSTLLRPGETYRHVTVHRFEVQQDRPQ